MPADSYQNSPSAPDAAFAMSPDSDVADHIEFLKNMDVLKHESDWRLLSNEKQFEKYKKEVEKATGVTK